jgi:hypothetical protein
MSNAHQEEFRITSFLGPYDLWSVVQVDPIDDPDAYNVEKHCSGGSIPEKHCSIDDPDPSSGSIPEKHRLVQVDPIDDPDAYNVEIQNLAKASQAYDRGLERFVGKFDPSIPMTATMAIEKGCHGDYGVAIFF